MKISKKGIRGGKHVIALLLMWAAGYAQAFDLIDVYRYAKKNDPQYQAALSRYKVDSLAKELGSALIQPNIVFSYGWNKNEYEASESTLIFTGNVSFDFNDCLQIGDTEDQVSCALQRLSGFEVGRQRDSYQSRDASLSLTQTVFDMEKFIEQDIARATAHRAALEKQQAEKDLILRVLDTYLLVLRNQNELEYTRQQLSSINTQLVLAKNRFELGVGDEITLFDAQAAYDAQLIAVDAAQLTYDNSLRQISHLTNIRVSSVAGLSEQMPILEPSPADHKSWVKTANRYNDNLRIAMQAEKLAQFDLRKAKSARLPTVDFGATYRENELSGGQGFIPGARTTVYGFNVNVPIYLGGRIGTTQKQAAYQLEESQFRVTDQRKKLEVQVINALMVAKADVKRYAAFKRAARSYERALIVREQAYKDGAISLPELFDAQQDYFDAKKKLASARYDYVSNTIQLSYIVGILSEKELSELNAWFESI